MNENNLYKTRKCTICGVEKPLSAFLERNTYGAICANCRAAASGTEDEGTTRKGHRIDDKAKIIAELDQKEEADKIKEQFREDHEQRDLEAEEKKEKKDLLAIEEKKHREFYLAGKKEGTSEAAKKSAAEKTFQEAQNKERGETSFIAEKEHFTNENQKGTVAEKEIRAKTSTDFTNPFFAPQFAEIRFTSNQALDTFRRQWAGNAPIAKTFGQAHPTTPLADKTQPTKTSGLRESLYKQAPAQKEKVSEPSLIEDMEKTWGPSSKR